MANLIKDTMVLQTKDYLEWDWGLLFSFLQHPSLKATHINEDALFSRCGVEGGGGDIPSISQLISPPLFQDASIP